MLETLGWTADLARAAAPWLAAGDGSAGRVVRVEQGLVSVLSPTGPQRASIGGAQLAEMARHPCGGPCVGDWVLLQDWPGHGTTLERVLPRRSCLVAAGPGGSQDRPLCCNVDLVAVVVPVHPPPEPSVLERLVTTARRSGAAVLVVLTRCDLAVAPARAAAAVAGAVPGVDVLPVSGRTGSGVPEVAARVGGRLTLALVGAPGSGRSTLTDALVGADVLRPRTGGRDGHGRRAASGELVPLPGGGAVIDTPGLRGRGLVDPAPGTAGASSGLAGLRR